MKNVIVHIPPEIMVKYLSEFFSDEPFVSKELDTSEQLNLDHFSSVQNLLFYYSAFIDNRALLILPVNDTDWPIIYRTIGVYYRKCSLIFSDSQLVRCQMQFLKDEVLLYLKEHKENIDPTILNLYSSTPKYVQEKKNYFLFQPFGILTKASENIKELAVFIQKHIIEKQRYFCISVSMDLTKDTLRLLEVFIPYFKVILLIGTETKRISAVYFFQLDVNFDFTTQVNL